MKKLIIIFTILLTSLIATAQYDNSVSVKFPVVTALPTSPATGIGVFINGYILVWDGGVWDTLTTTAITSATYVPFTGSPNDVDLGVKALAMGNTTVTGWLLFDDPGTDANSFILQMQADYGGTVQTGSMQVSYGGNPYLRLSAPDDAGTETPVLELHDESITLFNGAAGVDYFLNFNGESNDGTITYDEDNDGFIFSNDGNFAGALYANAISVTGAYNFPTVDGSANQIMETDGSSTVSWVDPSAGIIEVNPTNISSVELITDVDTSTVSFAHVHTEYTLSSSVNPGISQITFNESQGVIQFTTDIDGVVNQAGLEDYTRVYNNTGRTLDDGKIVYITGATAAGIATVDTSSYYFESIANRTIGMLTSTIEDGNFGFATTRGDLHDQNTIGLFGQLYLGAAGDPTTTEPKYPLRKLIIGGVSVIHATDGVIKIGLFRPPITSITTKSYPFTSNGVIAGTYYNAGYYDAPATDANLTQASLTQTLGTANGSYAAHAFMVFGAASVDAGVVGLEVEGTSITDVGVRTTSDKDTISFDITAHSLNEFVDSKKFVGQVTYRLIVISGSPTTYSLDFNYGWDKYEDFGNNNFTLVGIESTGEAGATDANFDIIVYHHNSTGWTYSAAAFTPGNTPLFSLQSIHGAEHSTINGEPFAFKRVPINQVIDGADSEGLIIQIITGANSTVQSMVTHTGVVIN